MNNVYREPSQDHYVLFFTHPQLMRSAICYASKLHLIINAINQKPNFMDVIWNFDSESQP